MIENITIDDIPESTRDIAQAIGIKYYIKIVNLAGGERIYIPVKKALEKEVRNRLIKEKYKGDIKALAREFKISETQIRNILEDK